MANYTISASTATNSVDVNVSNFFDDGLANTLIRQKSPESRIYFHFRRTDHHYS